MSINAFSGENVLLKLQNINYHNKNDLQGSFLINICTFTQIMTIT